MEAVSSTPTAPEGPKPKEFSVNVKIKGLPYVFKGVIPESQTPSDISWSVHIPYWRGLAPKITDRITTSGYVHSFERNGEIGYITGEPQVSNNETALYISKIRSNTWILPKDSPYYKAKGVGQFLMDNLLALADIKGWHADALLQPDGRLSDREMREWMTRKGFDWSTKRKPQKPDMTQAIAQILQGQEIKEKKKFDGAIRPLTRQDLPYLKRILETWVRSEGKLLSEEVEDDMNHLRGSLDRINNEHYLIAEDLNGRVVGMMGLVDPKKEVKQFATTEKPMELVRAYVDKDFRGGKGVGTALINHIQGLAKSRGATEILLDSGPRYKETGHGFYDKQPGFNRVGILPNFYGEGSDSIVWQKILS